MVHGLGGNSRNWSYLAPLLADSLDSVAPDLPGFGQSPPPRDGNYTPAGHAEAVIATIEESFAGRSVHLFGNSLGGHVATVVAAQRPDLVRSLTLVSPALPTFTPAAASIIVPITAMPMVGPRLVKRSNNEPVDVRATRMMDMVLGDISNAPDGWFDSVTADMASRDGLPYADDAYVQSARGLLKAFFNRDADNAWADAARVQAPTLLVFGQQDRLVPLVVARKARRVFNRSRLIVLPRTGHVAQIEQASVVAAAWRRFVSADISAGADAV
jgi:pimeloyl-ACP methyl ester carboxylesterase